MKKFLSLTAFLLCSFFVFAQNLIVQSDDKGLYLLHKVAAKENFYSIGRLYNISPKEIESFNRLDMTKGLSIGQSLKIPLSATNFSQSSDKGVPVYYVVGAKEGLYRVSLKNNNVLMANLRKWNKLPNDNISTGQRLIVGYLVSNEAGQLTVINNGNPIEEKEEPKIQKNEASKPNEEVPKIVEEPKRQEKEKPIPPTTKPVSNQVAVSDGSGGYFKSQFEAQVKAQYAKKDETASAGIFKTASGWQDGKYYALMDGVEPGTIIRIINPTNNKAVYAKVLGEMSGIRQNQGYDIRISNAAASVLNVSDTDKFIVRVNY